MLKIESLTRIYDHAGTEVVALESVSFIARENEFLAITGASGSGKTTLLGLLAGLDRPSSGSITVDETDLMKLSEDELAGFRGDSIGYIFQNYQLMNSLTALENTALPARLAGDKNALDKAKELLSKVGMGHRFDHYPAELSGGEQQRVAIARALSRSPRYLLADEPTGNLDSKNGAEILNLLQKARESATLILVTHNPELAALADRELVLSDGRLVDEVIHSKKKKAGARKNTGRSKSIRKLETSKTAGRKKKTSTAVKKTRKTTGNSKGRAKGETSRPVSKKAGNRKQVK